MLFYNFWSSQISEHHAKNDIVPRIISTIAYQNGRGTNIFDITHGLFSKRMFPKFTNNSSAS